MNNAKQRQAILQKLYDARQAGCASLGLPDRQVKPARQQAAVSDFKQADIRFFILKTLSEQAGFMANHNLLLFALDEYGYAIGLDRLRIELAWLDLTAETLTDGRHVATLNEKGRDVVEGRTTVPGIVGAIKQAYDNDDFHQCGWVNAFDLKNGHGDPAFALDVLVEIGYVKRNGRQYRITGTGVIACEGMQ